MSKDSMLRGSRSSGLVVEHTLLAAMPKHLEDTGLHAHIVRLPHGHDPNSYFVAGASGADFTACLGEAFRP